MKSYVHVDQDEAGYYVAEVPALPGCLSQGKTKEEALENIHEAISAWLEVILSIPQHPELGPGILRKIINQTNLSVDEFNRL